MGRGLEAVAYFRRARGWIDLLEHWMPLARMAMAQFRAKPTSTSRGVAKRSHEFYIN